MDSRQKRLHKWLQVAGLVLLATSAARAEDPLVRVAFTDDQQQQRVVEGRIVVEAADGGILLEERDQTLWTVTPEQLQQREATGATFSYYDADELGRRLQAEFGEGFEIVSTEHYVICTNAGTRYAEWCGSLFERLLAAFQQHWKGRPLQVREPPCPLPAIVFKDARQFAEFAARDAGPAASDAKGYYSIRSNRMVLYDLTAGPGSRPAVTPDDITRKVAASPFNVATVVHEATHQIAFNSGLHTRYADNPMWLTEGMAMYFETPDLRNRTGWRTVGQVNGVRLRRFQDYVRTRRRADSLRTLLADDARFTDPETAADAYAEAWALSYFLIKARRKLYGEYLQTIAQKPPLIWNGPDGRLSEFQAAFGEDLEKLDRDFLRFISRKGR